MENPGFFTLNFHRNFFPRLLLNKWREMTAPPPPRSPFANHVPLELTLLPMACLFLLGMGLPGALKHSPLGIVLVFLGAAGLAALLFMAIRGAWDQPAVYDNFSASVFLFILALGISAGIFYGSLNKNALWDHLEGGSSLTLRAALLGAALGYPLGIFAGLYNQKLGFLAFLPVLVSRLGMIGLIATDLVMIFGRR